MMCFYILLVLGAKISGSHYNPAVTLAFIFRKDVGRFSRSLGLAYILFQFAGAFLGNLVGLFYAYSSVYVGILDNNADYIVAAIVAEVLGTMVLTFLYLSQTEESTKVTQDPALSTLIISACYTGAVLMACPPNASQKAVLNPAIGFGACVVSLLQGNADSMKWFWIYLCMPFCGALLAVLFHEFIYKRAYLDIQNTEN
jgi:glycerol uptake facilitator-like aquaporin